MDNSPTEEFDPNKPIVVVGKKIKKNTKRFNLDSFRTEINRSGVISTHSYLISFSPFKDSIMNSFSDMMTLRCDSAILPSIALLKEENVRRYGYGPVETVAHGVQFGQVRLTWIVDQNADVISFFKTWFAKIVNHKSYGGSDMTTKTGSFSPYEIGYKDNYSNDKMTIFVYDKENKTVLEYAIYDCFPIMSEDIPLAWAETDSSIKYSITFAFTDIDISLPKTSTEVDDIIFEQLINEPTGVNNTYGITYTA